MSAIQKKSKRLRSFKFNEAWILPLGLEVSHRDPDNKLIVTLSCRFCRAFGREKVHKRTRNNTPISSVKNWNGPFRTDHIRRHMSDQHPQHWSTYNELTDAKKREYFKVDIPYAETLHAHFGIQQDVIQETVTASIVENILTGILESSEKGSKLCRFLKFNQATHDYTLRIERRKCFNIVVGQVQHGLSFRSVVLSLRELRSSAALAFMGNISEEDVSMYVQALAAMSLQRISSCLSDRRCWAFSIAIDGATVISSSYFDMRVRFYNGNSICNQHVIAIPLFGSHTGENMFDVVSKVLYSLVGDDWKVKLIGIATDGAANMVGRVSGVVTRIQNVCADGFYRVWCGAHQLDLAVQAVFEEHVKDNFQDPLHRLISYLRRQTNLIARMCSQCPTVATTRWLSLGIVCSWMVKRRTDIRQYLNEKGPAQSPDEQWWILLHAFNAIMYPLDVCFKSLQGKTTTIVEQNDRLKMCSIELQCLVSVKDVNNTGMDLLAAVATLEQPLTQRGGRVVQRSGALEFIEGLGSLVCDLFDQLPDVTQDETLEVISNMVLHLASRIDDLVAVRDARNAPKGTTFPAVLPADLALLRPKEFYSVMQDQSHRLQASFSNEEITQIEDEFNALRKELNPTKSSQSRSFAERGFEGFDAEWSQFGLRYRNLRYFCGGLATVFPGTSTVEADFSVLGREETKERSNLSKLCVSGALHSKQWKEVRRLTFSN